VEPPDRLEKGVRFGCGFLFGGALGVGALLTSLWSAHYIVTCVLVIALICGYAAMKFGDSFWENVRGWWWTWW
jgi:hypothetical protein